MARIRSIKPEFWVSEQIADCSRDARLTFIGLWTFSDDNGVHPAKPKTLKAELFAMDDIKVDDVAAWVHELIKAGLVAEFEGEGGGRYWHVIKWKQHQKIDRPSVKHPTPPTSPSSGKVQPPTEDSSNARRAITEESTPTRQGLVADSSSTRRTFDESSTSVRRAPAPGEEGKGEDERGEETSSPKARSTADSSNIGTRLPSDWVLPDDWRLYCIETRPDLDPLSVAETFRDYWHGKAGKDGRKADWLATWRNWVRNENAKGPATRGGASGRRSALHADDLIGEAL